MSQTSSAPVNSSRKSLDGAIFSPPRINREANDSRSRILKAAIELFSERGYRSVTMRLLASTVGLNQATLYHHFANKESLYKEALKWAYSDVANRLVALIRGPGTREQRLYRSIMAYCQDLSGSLSVVRLIKREQLAGDRERMEMLLDLLFGDWIKAEQELFAEFDSGLDAALFTTFFNGMVLHYYETSRFREIYEGPESQRNADSVGMMVYQCALGALTAGAAISPPE